MKKNLIILISIVLLFTQCQQNNNINPPTNSVLDLSGVCDSVSGGKYYYSGSTEFRIKGRIILDYNSVQIDSSDNDSVFVYINSSAQIDMNWNKSLANQTTLKLDTPTHVCLSGGPCSFVDGSTSHTKAFWLKENTVFKLNWSTDVQGLLISQNCVKLMMIADSKTLSSGHPHPALKPNFDALGAVNARMYNRDWYVATINTRTNRWNYGFYWDYY